MNPIDLAAQTGIITQADALRVLWYHERGDHPHPGSGYEKILIALDGVDADLAAALGRGIPSLYAAFDISARPRGLDTLRDIVNARHRDTLAEVFGQFHTDQVAS